MEGQKSKQHKVSNNNQKKQKKKCQEHISSSDIEKLMRHDSYCRGKGGAIRQVRHG